MSENSDFVNVTISHALLAEVAQVPEIVIDRMHELLERNNEGSLSATERVELESLIRIVEFSELVMMAFAPSG